MILTTAAELEQIIGGVQIFSPTGILIVTIGILFTIGLPLLMILKGRKD
tara:strand:+ start:359 stop:505 length:147 start_codon:yes stop_codon:yes gene_type:complete